MNDILNDSLAESKALTKARMTFIHRLAIIESLYGSSDSSAFPYSQINKLNALRNQLVHNIEPKNLEKNILVFVQEIEDPYPKLKHPKMKLENRLTGSIVFLIGVICGYREARRERKAPISKRLAKS